MIAIISDDEALGSNLEEILNLEDHYPISLFFSIKDFSESNSEQFDLIIYNNSEDPDGERFRWYLMANKLSDLTPVIFLNMVVNKGLKMDRPYHYIQLPFESEDLVKLVSVLHKKAVKH